MYDRDFPEVPLVIDLLEGEYLHVAEYERPDKRSVGQHRLWMDKLIEKAGEILKIPQNQIFFKRRRPQRGSSQYEKLSESGKMIIVREGGLKFLCNLTDYLDIGLFLDHRLTREMVRRESQGRRFLNLFCYTGSFTCYAAAGGAASTVSVDLSPTYLDWAQENMEENGFYDRSRDGKTEHRYIKADVLNFLQSIPPATGRSEKTGDKSSCHYGINRSDFELCVCDPPTFSNSKSTKKDWDVQQQHVELLRSLATRMVSGGVVYFSNNFRRFKLDEDHLTDIYQIREITNRTIPEEFRNKKIHHCWRLVVR
ncbi:MAG: class I SAM-dependent methyltransferase [Thermoguttaceae bacterium]|nr:class I SAM-dependent methyltransferase [Thermoguttaceae bacterium]